MRPPRCCFADCDEPPIGLVAIGFMRRYCHWLLRPECDNFYERMCAAHYDQLTTDRTSLPGYGDH